MNIRILEAKYQPSEPVYYQRLWKSDEIGGGGHFCLRIFRQIFTLFGGGDNKETIFMFFCQALDAEETERSVIRNRIIDAQI